VHTVPERYPAVAPLPQPPSSATLSRVLPYLAKLALSEKQLSWRLGVAFMCMVTSKAAGESVTWAVQFPQAFRSAQLTGTPPSSHSIVWWAMLAVPPVAAAATCGQQVLVLVAPQQIVGAT
jgi:hypothetical protein